MFPGISRSAAIHATDVKSLIRKILELFYQRILIE
jgi:hypothetical protein